MGVTEDGFPAFFNWPDPVIPRRKSGLVAVVALYRWQANGCAVCGRVFSPERNHHGERITHPVDHDHGSIMVRSVLCHSCNTLESLHMGGVHSESCDSCVTFDIYRIRNPASVLGLSYNYWDFMSAIGGRKRRFDLEDEYLHVR